MRKTVLDAGEFYHILSKITEGYHDDYFVVFDEGEHDSPQVMLRHHNDEHELPILTANEIMRQNNIRAKTVTVGISRDMADYAIIFFDMMDYLRFV